MGKQWARFVLKRPVETKNGISLVKETCRRHQKEDHVLTTLPKMNYFPRNVCQKPDVVVGRHTCSTIWVYLIQCESVKSAS